MKSVRLIPCVTCGLLETDTVWEQSNAVLFVYHAGKPVGVAWARLGLSDSSALSAAGRGAGLLGL